ncbi:unnamed protein product [Ceratitis capitata]|uniref:(Mediterranean fruit fly) hypothetical protein n=1 Tax=Ceratitis capitata TaxID=7213 RepID=A0A811UT34_CERCA|nr:unnamed protein product [Ceratitis capitata]
MRVIRAFRSTLEDLNERRSMHSLRSPRTTIPGYPLHNSNLLNPNFAQQQRNSDLQQQSHQLKNNNHSGGDDSCSRTAILAVPPSDITYIDEEPPQQQLQQCSVIALQVTEDVATINGPSVSQSMSNAFFDAAHQIHQQQEQKQLQTETRI